MVSYFVSLSLVNISHIMTSVASLVLEVSESDKDVCIAVTACTQASKKLSSMYAYAAVTCVDICNCAYVICWLMPCCCDIVCCNIMHHCQLTHRCHMCII